MVKKIDNENILLKNIIKIIQDAKGKEVISLNFKNIESSICKYFIICTGTSNIHVKAIESKIKKTISQKFGEKPWRTEGNNMGEWILMDYYQIIVHIFQENTRNFYNLEDFWGDAKFINYEEI